jgi:RNA polymerase sigma-70 factor (ECF subfamily)
MSTRTQNLPLASHERLLALRPWLTKVAESRVRNRQMAQDAVSETLLAGLEAPREILDSERLKPWLAGVLKNKLVDQLRLFGPRGVVVADDELSGSVDEACDAGSDPALAMQQHEFLAALEKALGTLSAVHARCFWMREVYEESTEAICAELGITAQNVWVITHRTRRRLQTMLQAWRLA